MESLFLFISNCRTIGYSTDLDSWSNLGIPDTILAGSAASLCFDRVSETIISVIILNCVEVSFPRYFVDQLFRFHMNGYFRGRLFASVFDSFLRSISYHVSFDGHWFDLVISIGNVFKRLIILKRLPSLLPFLITPTSAAN